MPRAGSSNAATGEAVEEASSVKPSGGALDAVAMGHPAGLLERQPGEQPAGLAHAQLRAAELADLGGLDDAAERLREQLHAVTDAEHRDAELEQRRVELRGARRVDRGRPAGEDQALRRAARDLGDVDVRVQQLGEHAALAHAARDQLRVLAAEVDDQHLVGAGARAAPGGAGGEAWRRRFRRRCPTR